MFLSRLTLDLSGRAALRDLQDSQAMHRTVMSGFPADGPADAVRASYGVLHRVDWDAARNRAYLLVQSAIAPDWGRLPAGFALGHPEVKAIGPQVEGLSSGQRLGFRLRANPTRKVGTVTKAEREAGARGNGKRVPLRQDEYQGWLARKGEDGGFSLASLEVRADHAAVGRDAVGFRRDGDAMRRLTHRAVIFEGELVIGDPERFRATVRAGIGSAKAYGFGLISLAPVGGST